MNSSPQVAEIINGLAENSSDLDELYENLTYLAGGLNDTNRRSLDFTDQRDIDSACQYPSTSELTVERYLAYYERFSIAARVIELWPEECWREPPKIYETEDNIESKFENSVGLLSQNLRGNNWYNSGNGSDVLWETLRQLDVDSGIGHYGCLYLGYSDVKDKSDLSKPVASYTTTEGIELSGQTLDMRFLRSLNEQQCQIATYDQNPTSERYNLPETYLVNFNTDYAATSNNSPSDTSVTVHWTRLVHVIPEGGTRNDVLGRPRLRAVINHLVDLRKLYGGSAEMFWQGGFPGIFFSTHPSLAGKVSIDHAKIDQQMAYWREGLKRHIALKGMTPHTVSTQTADPTNHIQSHLDAICIHLGVPKRIFMGSERGELASSQDAILWGIRLQTRKKFHAIPRIIVPLINRLIRTKILPEPPNGFKVDWDSPVISSDSEQAEILNKKVEAIVKYVQGDGQSLIPERNFLETFMGMSVEEVEAIIMELESEIPEDEITAEGE